MRPQRGEQKILDLCGPWTGDGGLLGDCVHRGKATHAGDSIMCVKGLLGAEEPGPGPSRVRALLLPPAR